MNTPRPPIAWLVLLACTALAACQRTDSVPPGDGAPAVVNRTTTAAPNALPAVPASGADDTVPDAGRALAGQEGAAAVASASTPGSGQPTANQKSTVTPEQESKSMPLPGQANDHSNTAGEKKPDAAPR